MAYHGPLPQAPRRSLSLPVRPAAQDPSQIEILYTLPSVRIISFTTATSALSPSSNSGSPSAQEEVGTLSWTSRFERTLAVGPLRIYRAPGSVAFLSCRETLRPILPKSQAWCVDEESSKFVLQIKRPQYWRIEIPHESSDDKLRSEQLKEILEKVLMFEKTACPFQRSFTVELPKAPETPVKKRPWKPVDRRKSESPLGQRLDITGKALGTPEANSSAKRSPRSSRSVSPLSSKHKVMPETPRKPSVVNSRTQTPPIAHIKLHPLPEETCPQEPVHSRQPSPSPGPRSAGQALSLLQSATSALEDSDSYSDYTDDTNVTPRNRLQARLQHFDFEPETPKAPDSLKACTRSNTVPPLLSLVTSPSSKHGPDSPLRRQSSIESDSSGTSLSGASFYSTQSWHTPLAPPSPPVSPTNTGNIVLPKRQSHLRDTSEITVTPETPRVRERSNSFPTIETETSDASPSNPPTLVSDKGDKSDEERPEVVTPPVIRPALRHRATTSSNSGRRTLSPLPPAVNLFSPPRRHSARHLQTARHLPTAIIQKTCEILLSPPGHLLNLMINIASKIAAGEWRGVLSGQGEAVHWDFTEDEYSSGDAWNEDDFGISLSGKPNAKDSNSSTSNTTMECGGSWEID